MEPGNDAEPVGHDVQAPAPCPEKVLSGHVQQVADALGAAVPAGQVWQVVDPGVGATDPTGQAWQVADPGVAAVPAGQVWQVADPPGDAVPAAQDWQPVAAHAAGWLPAGQLLLAPVHPATTK